MYRLRRILCALALATVLYAALLWRGPELNLNTETIMWAEPQVAEIYVHGENAHFTLRPGFGEDVLLINGADRHYCRPAAFINRGLYLPQLAEGLYRVYAADLSVLAPPAFELGGYTVTRHGQNLRYLFCSEQGRLVLRVSAEASLPEEVFDVLIDPGHGGSNNGAARRGRLEKEENLRASLYMAQLFRAAGLKTALTRDGDYVPGQPGVAEDDIDPYVPGGRVYLNYATQAKYYIVNHLDSSPGNARRGWQLFRSVQADEGWQQAIAAAFYAYGHQPNDDAPGFGQAGIYRRYSQDNERTGSDYYYFLRETGGELTKPRNFSAAYPQMDLRRGAESMLIEYLFLVNTEDLAYWDENWQGLVEAVVEGCLRYWGIER